MRRIVVALTGATGVLYGVRLLERLRSLPDVESHLVISQAGGLTLQQELQRSRESIEGLAHVMHSVRDIGASIASGSFVTEGMIVAPCSMKTLASIAHGLSDNLISRAADVMLKERRRLVLMVREAPFSLIHLRNMTTVTEMGGIIYPPLPAFYSHPQTIDALIDHTVSRVLHLFQLAEPEPEWMGMHPSQT